MVERTSAFSSWSTVQKKEDFDGKTAFDYFAEAIEFLNV